MADFTRKAIKTTFIELLNERPLSKISVKDVVEACGITRSSFYYHFCDISALVEEIVKEEAERIIDKYPSINSVSECFDALIEFASNKKRAIMHVYRSVNRDVFEFHLMNISEYLVKNYFQVALAGGELSKESRDSVINYYKCVFFGLVLNWLAEGMPEDWVRRVRNVVDLQQEKELEIVKLLYMKK